MTWKKMIVFYYQRDKKSVDLKKETKKSWPESRQAEVQVVSTKNSLTPFDWRKEIIE